MKSEAFAHIKKCKSTNKLNTNSFTFASVTELTWLETGNGSKQHR